jgi:hypothetical protein
MHIDKALTNIQTGMIYRTRKNGEVVKVIFRDGVIRQVLINDILVDDGSGVSGENEMTIELLDIVADDWEEAKGF